MQQRCVQLSSVSRKPGNSGIVGRFLFDGDLAKTPRFDQAHSCTHQIGKVWHGVFDSTNMSVPLRDAILLVMFTKTILVFR